MQPALAGAPAGSPSPASVRARRRLWLGRVLSTLPVIGLALSASLKLSHAPAFAAQFTDHLGYPLGALTPIGLLEAACVALYTVPRTAALGAVLLTGYLGGAIATHVRVGEPFAIPIVFGVLVWLGLYLRDERVRALMR